MNENVEQRKYSRSLISLSVQVRLETGVLVEGNAKNVSLNGLFFETERSLPLGSRVKVIMSAGNGEEKTEISCTGKVSRLNDCGVAIELGKMDESCLMQLCDLIRSTATDKLVLEKELEQRLQTLRAGDTIKTGKDTGK